MIITDDAIAKLRAKGATAVDGRKLDFPDYVPAPWAKLSDGTVLVAMERWEHLVAR